MSWMPWAAALVLVAQAAEDPKPRFESRSPLPGAAAVLLDPRLNDVGEAQRIARERNLQARILWIDATANLDRTSSEEKIVGLVKQVQDAGFNTIVFDVKPISGHLMWPSKLAPRMLEWRGKTMPADFDPVEVMVREAKRVGMPIYASLNAFSEGHRMFLVGPGYSRPRQQTVLYEIQPVVAVGERRIALHDKANEAPEGKVGVFTSASRVPAPKDGAFAVTLDRFQKVVDGFEQGGLGDGVPTVPRGGSILFGTGDAAAFLREAAVPGAKVSFDTDPVFVPIRERPEQQFPLMMNPNDPEVQLNILEIVKELVTKYAFDGIVFDDRLRYGGMNADFSETTRRAFEAKVGRSLRWPDDVFKFTIGPSLAKGIRTGPYYDRWMSFRAETLGDFLGKVRHLIDEVRPGTQLGVYAGSWYGEYQGLGNNWASPRAEGGFWFLTPEYQATGFARRLDFLMTGCYYPTATVAQAMEAGKPIGTTVEMAGALSNRMVRDDTWVYAGIALSDFKDDPDGLVAALQAACGSTQGVMVFDLSHDIDPMWPVFARAFATPRTAPHRAMDALVEARRVRAMNDVLGRRDPPVVIAAGGAGTGQ